MADMLEKLKRWVKFNVVGGGGVIVQLALLAILTQLLDVHYLLATLIAVEGAILHNFVWHQKWTWRDQPTHSLAGIGSRLLRFHLSNGLTSILGNTLLIKVFVDTFQLPVVIAGLAAIAVCSLLNFLLSDLFVFRADTGFAKKAEVKHLESRCL